MDDGITRRTLFRAGLAVPVAAIVADGAAACASMSVVAGPIARFAAQTAINAFAAKTLDLVLETDFSPALLAARDKLEQAAGPMAELFGAQVTPLDGDLVLTGILVDNPRLGSSLQPFDWQPVTLPLPVQIGLAYHAEFLMRERGDTNWNGWSSLSRAQKLSTLRRELLVRNIEPTDQTDLTDETVFLCTIRGGGPAEHNDNIEIAWKPSTDKVEQTLLTVRRGNVPNDRDEAVWEPEYDMPPIWIHFEELWKEAPA